MAAIEDLMVQPSARSTNGNLRPAAAHFGNEAALKNGHSHKSAISDERLVPARDPQRNGHAATRRTKDKPSRAIRKEKRRAKSRKELLALGAITGAAAAINVLQNPAMLKPDQLLERYDPDEPANAIGRQLGVVAGSKQFLIFDGDALNRELSRAELHRLLRGFLERSIAIYRELPYQTFAVGNRPQRYTDQSPWDGLALYDGESNNGVAWMRLPKATRRLVFIASQLLALPDLQKYAEIELFRVLAKAESKRKGSSFLAGARLFPAAFIQFRDYERQDHLPPLKVALGTT